MNYVSLPYVARAVSNNSITSTILGEVSWLLEQFLFELGPDMGKSVLKPRIGYRPENSRNKFVACVNSSVYWALLKNKPPIHVILLFFEVATSKSHKPPSG
jgi:hypothetical protein